MIGAVFVVDNEEARGFLELSGPYHIFASLANQVQLDEFIIDIVRTHMVNALIAEELAFNIKAVSGNHGLAINENEWQLILNAKSVRAGALGADTFFFMQIVINGHNKHLPADDHL